MLTISMPHTYTIDFKTDNFTTIVCNNLSYRHTNFMKDTSKANITIKDLIPTYDVDDEKTLFSCIHIKR